MGLDIRIFGADVKSKSSTISAQDRTNVYFDIPTESDRAPVAAYGTAGTVAYVRPSGAKTRGMYYMPSTGGFFCLQGTKLFLIKSGFPELIATIDSTDGEAHFADNGTQLLLITRDNGYIIDTKNNWLLTDISDQLPPERCDSCCFLDGYFIVNRRGTGQFFISNVYNGLVWDALNFATAEASPDNLVAVIANNGYLYLLGTYTTEIWVNSGGALFPFSRVQGAAITYGLVSVDSLAIMNTSLVGLVRDRYGMLAIGSIANGQFTELSTPDISYIINGYYSTSSADAFVYALNGRYFYQITFNNLSSWLYDFKSGAWSRIASWGQDYSKYRYGLAFDNKFIVSSSTNGQLAQLSADIYTEEGSQVVREVVFNHVFAPSQNFTLISRLRAWFETGQGLIASDDPALPQGVNPTVMLQISRDSGHTWGAYRATEVGRRGEFNSRAEWRRLGQARNWTFKIRMTDPIRFCLTDISLAIGEANN